MTNPFRRSSASRGRSSRRTASRIEPRRTASRQEPRRMKVRELSRLANRRQESLYDESGTFNPQRFERGDSRRRSVRATTNRRMFDSRGQVNAYDRRDALTQTNHLLNNINRREAANISMTAATGYSADERRRILAAALKDPSGHGFHRIGQELALPIKAILDYEGFSRKIYRVRKLGQAELFRLPKDIRSVAYVIGQDGMTPEARIKTKWITPEEFKVTSFPSIDIQDIYQANFDILERAQDTARQEIELQEDKAGINLLDTAAQAVNDVTTIAGNLTLGGFEAVRYQVERHRLLVENFIISRAEVTDIVVNMSTAVDPVTERELILAGYIGNILNSQILTTAGTGVEEVVPAGTIYACTGPDYLGEMGERIELFSEPYNKYAVGETVKGWSFVEMIGFAIPNAKAVAKGMK